MLVHNTFSRLEQSYLFSTISRKSKAYQAAHPDAKIIRLSIGDVTLPLTPTIIKALHAAVDEMGRSETFRGYCDDAEGYEFLRSAVADHYARLGASVDVSEVFISDGAKSDLGNILDIFAPGSRVLIPNPVYPAYVDTNLMAGNEIVFLEGNAENGFLPYPDDSVDVDVVYICSPNNPTGATYDTDGLASWVDYALRHEAVILFDSAYEAFIRDESLPHSIFEVDGADRCAIEVSSLSKRAGFTGLRCGFTVVPNGITVANGNLNAMWRRRQNTKFNGVPYIVQRAAEAAFSELGRRETAAQVDVYLENARIIGDALDELGIAYRGGKNSPYIWMECPGGMRSWDFFDLLLEKAQVVVTPGVGFGSAGEGYARITAFGRTEDCKEAMARIREALKAEGLV